MPQAPGDPRAVECPRCRAEPGEPCLRPNGDDAPKEHAARGKVAAAAAAARRKRAEGEAPERISEPRWRRLYIASRLELEQRGDWTRLAAEQLETMVRNMRAADKARDGAEIEPLVLGSTGQKVANPLWATSTRLDEKALGLAKALKLTPDTRGTSAPVGDDGPELEGDDDVVRDELAELDELARKRKEKAAAG